MKGAIIGDIIGSIYEFNNYNGNLNDFQLFTKNNFFTDDTICTCGIAKTLLEKDNPDSVDYARNLWTFCNQYPALSYGRQFHKWLQSNPPKPYQSYGNGAAMRISAIPYFFKDNLDDCIRHTTLATIISHNHNNSIYYTHLINKTIWQLINHTNIEIIKRDIQKQISLPQISKIDFNETCQGTVPICFSILFDSNSFEEVIRKAVWIGGDTDTICAIVGSMAAPLFGIPNKIEEKIFEYVDETIKNIILEFDKRIKVKI